MKVRASVKKICRNCKIVRRNGVVRVICTDLRPSFENPQHDLSIRPLEQHAVVGNDDATRNLRCEIDTVLTFLHELTNG